LIIAENDFPLAEEISKKLNIKLVSPQITIFPSGELEIHFPYPIPETVIFINELGTDINYNIIKTLLIIDTLRKSGAVNIIFIATYLPYLRFDRAKSVNISYGSKFFTNMLENSGITKLIIVEPHFLQITGFFNIPVEIISTLPVFENDIRQRFNSNDLVIVSPDIGGHKNIIAIGESLNLSISCANKYRSSQGEILRLEFNDKIENKICIIIDDLIDTGKTIMQLASLLKARGAKKVIAYITHGVFSQNSLELFSHIDQLYITDSIRLSHNYKKVNKISIAEIIANYIKKSWKF
jgi:ribose-phosphate pyrophosphokinase